MVATRTKREPDKNRPSDHKHRERKPWQKIKKKQTERDIIDLQFCKQRLDRSDVTHIINIQGGGTDEYRVP